MVTLQPAGGGNFKGLCPFHDEKSPSFSVRPVGGVIPLLRLRGGRRRHLVRDEDRPPVLRRDRRTARGSLRHPAPLRGGRVGHQPAARPAHPARRRAQHRRAVLPRAAGHPGCGRRPAVPGRARLRPGGRRDASASASRRAAGTSSTQHLLGRGFTTEELVTAGLAREGQRGPIDRFMARLLWPIRDIAGDVVGFGARRLFDDDRIEAKYLNTPETPIYKKSMLLYGLDLAKRDIARRLQAVVVEGYTDVMACHLAGVPTAVATCGTAFGDEHIKILRRLLMDQAEFRGEVVFTFDGDSAGQKAALKAFQDDQKFVTQTFVAVEPSGMDPCELRQHKGDAAVRDLVARRVPLFEFAIRSSIGTLRPGHRRGPHPGDPGRHGGRPADPGRLAAGRLRPLAGRLGRAWRDPDELVRAARGDVGRRRPCGRPSRAIGRPTRAPTRVTRRSGTSATCSRSRCRRLPWRRGFDDLDAAVFTAPAYAGAARRRAGGRGRGGRGAGRPGVGHRGPRGGRRRRGAPAGPRAGGRAVALRRPGPHAVRHRGARPAGGAGRHPSDRRGQVAAAADQPGRAERRVQPRSSASWSRSRRIDARSASAPSARCSDHDSDRGTRTRRSTS